MYTFFQDITDIIVSDEPKTVSFRQTSLLTSDGQL